MGVSSEIRSTGVLRTLFLSSSALILVIAVVASPKEAFDASIQGLDIWWKIVFPAMLPFLMLSQMLTAFGFTHAIGVLLEPLMKRLFKLPGNAGFALAVGMCGGFPAAADAVSHLIQDKQMTARQAVIVVATAHFANPMMILLVIGAAFLHQPAAGYFLLAIHWISGWIAAAVVVRLQPAARKDSLKSGSTSISMSTPATKYTAIPPAQHQDQITEKPSSSLSQATFEPSQAPHKPGVFTRMLQAAREAHSRDARGFGKLLGDTVSHAVQTLMLTGGYIIVFAVFIRLLSLYLTPGISAALWPSILELHLGTYHISKATLAPSMLMALLAAALGWGGVCSHLQVTSMLRNAMPGRQSVLYFVLVRLAHALTSFGLALWLWNPFSQYSTEAWTAWQNGAASESHPVLLQWFKHAFDTTSTIQIIGSAFPVAAASLSLLLVIMISLSGITLWLTRRFSR
ncbi:nucleoside recognition protein [Paenibacillus barcinonensis]|uniref:Nucleoside recognition protein n=1 Tax=Paenibacillus barcinonensis TaxID=198119 RepID=A0A2V4VES9_PAEBA|nr:nucleoside recognition domain-containing protein [Paenibacillus barcinonensis]PYE52246.1 sporulation integral membrane protein YlbJ [Paenibacillus barcinonensis]QKS59621.1 nucleoside recognition protein [Paenibacillus barcinonensis]